MDLMTLEKVDRVITGQHCIVSLGITGVTRPSRVVITRSSLSQYHIGQITAVEQKLDNGLVSFSRQVIIATC